MAPLARSHLSQTTEAGAASTSRLSYGHSPLWPLFQGTGRASTPGSAARAARQSALKTNTTPLTLHPSGDGIFDVTLLTSEGELVLFSRAEEGRFPENKELKNLVRDAIDPGRDLGHSEAEPTSRNSGTTAFDRLVRGE